jgi:type 1 fimbriae regulatory protein FimB/type 1 fimbriae regulatory protein FimE
MAAIIPLRQFPQDSFSARCKALPPVRQPNKAVRTREHLTPDEVERMIAAVRKVGGRLADRDVLLIMLAYRHGLRAKEVVQLRWDQVDRKVGKIYIARAKNGEPSTHPVRSRALSAWQRKQGSATPYIFTALGGDQMTTRTVHYVVAQAGKAAGIKFPVHPHMLRHATGYYLANSGQDTRAIQLYLGHKGIQHTVRYTNLSTERFKDFWKD